MERIDVTGTGYHCALFIASHLSPGDDWLKTAVEDEVAQRLLSEWSPSPHYYVLDAARILVIKAPVFDKDNDIIDTVAIRAYIKGDRLTLISIQEASAVTEIIAQLKHNPEKAQSPFGVLALIAQRIAIQLRNLSIKLVDRLDTFEDDVINPATDVSMIDLVTFRRTIIMLNRFSHPQAEALEEFASDGMSAANSLGSGVGVSELTRDFLTPTVAAARKLNELLISLRQRSEAVAQALELGAQQKSEKMSYLLTLAAGIFLPINLVVGLFGVNVGGVPWVDKPSGFLLLAALLGLTSLISALLTAAVLKWIGRKRLG